MICPYCKTKLPDGSLFCSSCGQAIPAPGNQSTTSSSYWNTVEEEVARDEKIRTDAENEFLEKQKKKRRTVLASIIASVIVIILIGIAIFYNVSIYPSQQYATAIELLENGAFNEAMTIFEDLGNYKDCEDQIYKCQEGINEQRYQDGIVQYQNGNYNEALSIFEKLDTYKESQSFAQECRLQIWEVEDNNTYQTATSISLNKEYFGILESEWETEQDWYSFTLEAPGRVQLVFNSEKQGSEDKYWDVSIRSKTNPDEDLWQEYIAGETTKTESLTLSLSAGVYYVEIESSNRHSTDIYSFVVVHEENEGNWEVESNNTYKTANSIFPNKEYFGVLQSEWETEQDWYSFTLEATGNVSLVFNSQKQSSDSSYWDISIRSKDNPDQDLWQEFVSGDTTKTESDTLSLSAGTYYVEIESSNSHSTDTYSFKVITQD